MKMKKNVFKTAFAAICVVAAGMGAFKTYDKYNDSLAVADVLLADNVEALSQYENDVADRDNTRVENKGDVTSKCACGTKKVYKNGAYVTVNKYKVVCETVNAKVHSCVIPNPNLCV